MKRIRIELPGYLFYDRPEFIKRISAKLRQDYGSLSIKFSARIYGLLKRELSLAEFKVNPDRQRLLLEIVPINAPRPSAMITCSIFEVPKGRKSDKQRAAKQVAEYQMRPLITVEYKVEL